MQKQQYPHSTLFLLLLASHLIYGPPLLAVTISGPDGQELILEKLYMQVVVEGPLSLTEMSMVFHNPQNRMIEGKFKIALPEGATVSRFSKEVNGKMMEGEVVERHKAKRIYTKILHTPRDPALLEHDQGNEFTSRIYPIRMNETFRIILSYSSLTPMNESGKRVLTIPFRKLPKVGDFKMAAYVKPAPNENFLFRARGWFKDLIKVKKAKDDNKMVLLIEKKEFLPKEDLKLTFEVGNEGKENDRTTIYRYKDLQMVCYRRRREQTTQTVNLEDWRWYVDTSTSMKVQCANLCQVVKALLKSLEESTPPSKSYLECRSINRSLHVFHTETKKLHSWNKIGIEREIENAIGKLQKHDFFGGTDLRKTWRTIKEDSDKRDRATNYVIVTDGCATFGDLPVKEMLAQPLKSLHRLHVIVIGCNEDSIGTRTLARWGQGHIVHLPMTVTWQDEVKSSVRDLLRPLGRSFHLSCKSCLWTSPKHFYDIKPGKEIVASNNGQHLSKPPSRRDLQKKKIQRRWLAI